MAVLKHMLWLSFKKIDVVTKRKLLDYFGNSEDIFIAGKEEYLQCGFLSKQYVDALNDKDLTESDIVLEKCARLNIKTTALGDTSYPQLLSNIIDPPLILYSKGRLVNFENKLIISMVGTRKCTPYGSIVTENLSYNLAKNNVIVVSGMATGIDSFANIGALRAGGQTIAVLGCGIDICYPRENHILMDDIIATGMVISEYPPGTKPESKNFPIRNRIISGISNGVVITECPERSGALITANYAQEQGREVFAVPGNIDRFNSIGCNNLIKEFAIPVTCAFDIIKEYGWFEADDREFLNKQLMPTKKVNTADRDILETNANPQQKKGLDLSQYTETQGKIIKAVMDGAGNFDEIASKTFLDITVITSTITILEIKGIIKSTNGRYYVALF